METLSIVQCRVQVVLQGRQGSLEGAVQVVLWPLTCVPKGPNVDTTTTSSFPALMGTGIKNGSIIGNWFLMCVSCSFREEDTNNI